MGERLSPAAFSGLICRACPPVVGDEAAATGSFHPGPSAAPLLGGGLWSEPPDPPRAWKAPRLFLRLPGHRAPACPEDAPSPKPGCLSSAGRGARGPGHGAQTYRPPSQRHGAQATVHMSHPPSQQHGAQVTVRTRLARPLSGTGPRSRRTDISPALSEARGPGHSAHVSPALSAARGPGHGAHTSRLLTSKQRQGARSPASTRPPSAGTSASICCILAPDRRGKIMKIQ